VRDAVRAGVERCGCSPDATADIVLAIDEACQNIIRHAYCGECDDASPNVHPGVAEVCNGVDDDCDGDGDEGDPGGGPACETGDAGACVAGHLAAGARPGLRGRTPAPGVHGGDEDCDGFTNTRDPASPPGRSGIDADDSQ
jgi:hypothetical protein